jgi:hypothetical protein
VKSRVGRKPDSSLTAQLEVEIEWLAGRLPGSVLRSLPELSPANREIVSRIEDILRRPCPAKWTSMAEPKQRGS